MADNNTKDQRMVTKAELDESLERVMNNILLEMKLLRDEMNGQFSSLRARLDRQGGLIQSGARAMLRHERWAEDSDRRYDDLSAEIRTLDARLSRLERQ